MVAVVQWLESLTVTQGTSGSTPPGHPIFNAKRWRAFAKRHGGAEPVRQDQARQAKVDCQPGGAALER